LHKRAKLFEKVGNEMHEVIEAWLHGRELTTEQNVAAQLVLNLARDYDEKRFTSTAEALRRSWNDLRALLKPAEIDFDPLHDLLTR
jgi:hypothetical protein